LTERDLKLSKWFQQPILTFFETSYRRSYSSLFILFSQISIVLKY